MIHRLIQTGLTREQEGSGGLADTLISASGLKAATDKFPEPIEALSIAQALATSEVPVGPLLREAQGEADLQLAHTAVRKLMGRLDRAGRTITETLKQDAISSACLALAQWRALGGAGERFAERVVWRAVTAEFSTNRIVVLPLHLIPDHTHELIATAESRPERAVRWRAERLARSRSARLPERLGKVPAGRGNRRRSIARVGHATALLMAGESLNRAAELAGFKPKSDRMTGGAGARLTEAAKRLGLIEAGFTVRRRGWEHRSHHGCQAVSHFRRFVSASRFPIE